MQIIVLLTALFLSGVAAYYSIIGLTAIFSGAFWSILMMGAALEVAKLVSVSWLYRNWDQCSLLMRSYMTSAIAILMLITSMGIFGYLSRAHIESSAANTSDLIAQIETLNDNIASKEFTRDLYIKQITNIDNTLVKYIELGSVTRGLQEKRRLDSERKTLETNRSEIDKELIALKSERNKLLSEQKKQEVEIGPLKYIAELIYGKEAENHFDSAVRWVIILLVLVFDPLAIVLLIAANTTHKTRGRAIKVSGKKGYVEVHKSDILDVGKFK
jgi:hypothetical protein